MKKIENPQPQSIKKIYQYAFSIFSLCLILFTIGICIKTGKSPHTFFKVFIKTLFRPSPNYCFAKNIFSLNIMKLFYFFLCLILFAISGLGMIVKNSQIPWKQLSARILSASVIIYLLFLSMIQPIARLVYLEREQLHVHHPSSEFSILRKFTSKSKELIPGRHQAKIESDQSLKIDPYQFIQRTIAYYLYPEFSVRFENELPMNCIFYFDKKDFSKGIPEGYTLIYINPTGYMAIAVKNEILPYAD